MPSRQLRTSKHSSSSAQRIVTSALVVVAAAVCAGVAVAGGASSSSSNSNSHHHRIIGGAFASNSNSNGDDGMEATRQQQRQEALRDEREEAMIAFFAASAAKRGEEDHSAAGTDRIGNGGANEGLVFAGDAYIRSIQQLQQAEEEQQQRQQAMGQHGDSDENLKRGYPLRTGIMRRHQKKGPADEDPHYPRDAVGTAGGGIPMADWLLRQREAELKVVADVLVDERVQARAKALGVAAPFPPSCGNGPTHPSETPPPQRSSTSGEKKVEEARLAFDPEGGKALAGSDGIVSSSPSAPASSSSSQQQSSPSPSAATAAVPPAHIASQQRCVSCKGVDKKYLGLQRLSDLPVQQQQQHSPADMAMESEDGPQQLPLLQPVDLPLELAQSVVDYNSEGAINEEEEGHHRAGQGRRSAENKDDDVGAEPSTNERKAVNEDATEAVVIPEPLHTPTAVPAADTLLKNSKTKANPITGGARSRSTDDADALPEPSEAWKAQQAARASGVKNLRREMWLKAQQEKKAKEEEEENSRRRLLLREAAEGQTVVRTVEEVDAERHAEELRNEATVLAERGSGGGDGDNVNSIVGEPSVAAVDTAFEGRAPAEAVVANDSADDEEGEDSRRHVPIFDAAALAMDEKSNHHGGSDEEEEAVRMRSLRRMEKDEALYGTFGGARAATSEGHHLTKLRLKQQQQEREKDAAAEAVVPAADGTAANGAEGTGKKKPTRRRATSARSTPSSTTTTQTTTTNGAALSPSAIAAANPLLAVADADAEAALEKAIAEEIDLLTRFPDLIHKKQADGTTPFYSEVAVKHVLLARGIGSKQTGELFAEASEGIVASVKKSLADTAGNHKKKAADAATEGGEETASTSASSTKTVLDTADSSNKNKKNAPPPAASKYTTTIELLPFGKPLTIAEQTEEVARRNAQSARFAKVFGSPSGSSSLAPFFFNTSVEVLSVPQETTQKQSPPQPQPRVRRGVRPAHSSTSSNKAATTTTMVEKVAVGDVVLAYVELFTTDTDTTTATLPTKKEDKNEGSGNHRRSRDGEEQQQQPLRHIVSGLRAFQVGSYCNALQQQQEVKVMTHKQQTPQQGSASASASPDVAPTSADAYLHTAAAVSSTFLPQDRYNTIKLVHDGLVGAVEGEQRRITLRSGPVMNVGSQTLSASAAISSSFPFGARGNQRLGIPPYYPFSSSTQSPVTTIVVANVTLLRRVAMPSDVDDGLFGDLVRSMEADALKQSKQPKGGKEDDEAATSATIHNIGGGGNLPTSMAVDLYAQRLRASLLLAAAQQSNTTSSASSPCSYVANVGECIEGTVALHRFADGVGESAVAYIEKEVRPIMIAATSKRNKAATTTTAPLLEQIPSYKLKTDWDAFDLSNFLFAPSSSSSSSSASSSSATTTTAESMLLLVTDSKKTGGVGADAAAQPLSAERQIEAFRRASALSIAAALNSNGKGGGPASGAAGGDSSPSSSSSSSSIAYWLLLRHYWQKTGRAEHNKWRESLTPIIGNSSSDAAGGSSTGHSGPDDEYNPDADKRKKKRMAGLPPLTEAERMAERRRQSEMKLEAMLRQSTRQLIDEKLGSKRQKKGSSTHNHHDGNDDIDPQIAQRLVEEKIRHQLGTRGRSGSSGKGMMGGASETQTTTGADNTVGTTATASSSSSPSSIVSSSVPVFRFDGTEGNGGGSKAADGGASPPVFTDASAALHALKLAQQQQQQLTESAENMKGEEKKGEPLLLNEKEAGAIADATRQHLLDVFSLSRSGGNKTMATMAAVLDASLDANIFALLAHPEAFFFAGKKGAQGDQKKNGASIPSSPSLSPSSNFISESVRSLYADMTTTKERSGKQQRHRRFAVRRVPFPPMDHEVKEGQGQQDGSTVGRKDSRLSQKKEAAMRRLKEKRGKEKKSSLSSSSPTDASSPPILPSHHAFVKIVSLNAAINTTLIYAFALQHQGRVQRTTFDYAAAMASLQGTAEALRRLHQNAHPNANTEHAAAGQLLASTSAIVDRYALSNEASLEYVITITEEEDATSDDDGEDETPSPSAEEKIATTTDTENSHIGTPLQQQEEAANAAALLAAASQGPYGFLVGTLGQSCDDVLREWCRATTTSTTTMSAAAVDNGRDESPIDTALAKIDSPLSAALNTMMVGGGGGAAPRDPHTEALRALRCPPLYREVLDKARHGWGSRGGDSGDGRPASSPSSLSSELLSFLEAKLMKAASASPHAAVGAVGGGGGSGDDIALVDRVRSIIAQPQCRGV